jgi:hypothetical protein
MAEDGYIAPVSERELRLAAERGAGRPPDPSTLALMAAEKGPIAERRGTYHLAPPGDDLTGIALSGGGIRSASFSLGVLQALAARDLLKRLDYLSTVSGGGFIGSALTRWAGGGEGDDERPAFGVRPRELAGTPAEVFPWSTDDPSAWRGQRGRKVGARLLQHLRSHGNYLVPGEGITLLSALSVVTRGMIIQLLLFLPLLVVLLLVLMAGLDLWTGARPPPLVVTPLVDPLPLVLGGGLLTLAILALGALYWRASLPGAPGLLAALKPWLARPRAAYAALFAVAALGLVQLVRLDAQHAWHGLRPLAAVALMMLVAFVLLAGVYSLATGVSRLLARADTRMMTYDIRRLWESWAGFGAVATVTCGVVGAVPFLADALIGRLSLPDPGAVGGVGALLAGLATTGWAYLRSARTSLGALVGGRDGQPWLSASLGAAFLILGLVLVAHEIALWLYRAGSAGTAAAVVLGLLVVALALLVDINHTGLHRFYRDRLMEAFMPGFREALQGRTGPVPDATEQLGLARAGQRAAARAPYHLINANAVMINARDPRARLRGGDGFLLSPLFCGGNLTGWRVTREFMGNGMTLATAMAISGAAANPNTGTGGLGAARSRPVAIAMALANLRLGYWVPHPGRAPEGGAGSWWRRLAALPSQLRPGLCAFLPVGHHERHPWQELTDGGHFENLGLYELARRRLRLIVVVDAAEDRAFRFGALQNALRRIGEDFGARVCFGCTDACTRSPPCPGDEIGVGEQGPLDGLIPELDLRYPSGARLARRGWLRGVIRYADGTRGTLVYLKTTLVPDLALALLGYRDRNPDFPDQSTADQFFDEEQLEAYRELGYRIADSMIDGAALEAALSRTVPDVAPASEA